MTSPFVALRGSLLLLASVAAPALTQIPLRWATHGISRAEQEVLHPLIQSMLRDGTVGEVRVWRSVDGKTGKVTLLDGGERAGSFEAHVRITLISHGHERPFFTFYYRHDPKRGWGVAG
ncbi:hypothetical protein SAMN05444678_1285 [Sphingomonas sp. YR710]|uniref:hypothetical protein n=1 Tax=Sphingomonas sp. YR710 TaxID=1882773 RepID=UPI00088B6D7F|nr:hypothetical protein [Sphingomonas sp. YR710]SDD86786.1 hypothetical protein SAMN05444678_1285 [Sphingomonas sp. YR710]